MSEEEAIETAFHDVTEAAGGTHIADGGWMWLEGFGDVRKEYEAARDDVAVWDVSPLNKWDFRGPDALKAAQHVWSERRARPGPGAGALRGVPRRRRVDGRRRHRLQHWASEPLLGHDERQGPRGLLRRDAEGLRRGVRVDSAEDAPPRCDRAALARGRPIAHRRRRLSLEVLPLLPGPREGRRRAGVPVTDRVRRRARLRAVPDEPSRCGRAVGCGDRRRRDAVRRREHRDPSDRVRAHRHRLRLRGAPAHAVRLQHARVRRSRL